MVDVKMDPAMHCGVVRLAVCNLEQSLVFYRTDIGLRVLERDGARASLGIGDRLLLELFEQPDALPVQRGHTGLYHFALLLPDRPALSRMLNHLLALRTPLDGGSDHGVSEAIYLSDPDGHGIELYRDRPRREWPFAKSGLGMTTDPLDARGLMTADRSNTGWEGIDPRTVMGHVHLHIAHMPAAEHFYVGLLGLDLMQQFGSQASFVSAGGYHHHLGLNTWAGVGAPPPPQNAARLLEFELVVPDEAALQATVDRLQAAGVSVEPHSAGWAVLDPSANRIVLVRG